MENLEPNTRINIIKEDRRNDDKRQITEDDLETLTNLVVERLQERAQVRIRLIRSILAWILRAVGATGTLLAVWHHEAIKLSIFG